MQAAAATNKILTSGFRPGSFVNLDATELFKRFVLIFLAILLIILVLIEVLGLELPQFLTWNTTNGEFTDIMREQFVNYYTSKPVARNSENNASLAQYDGDVLRANRYYTKDPINNSSDKPITSLSSLTTELPTTYMIDLLDKIKVANSPFYIALPANLVAWYRSQQTSTVLQQLAPTPVWQTLDKLQPIDMPEELAQLFFIIRLKLVTMINMKAIELRYSDPAHKFALFEIVNSQNTKVIPNNSTNPMAGMQLNLDF